MCSAQLSSKKQVLMNGDNPVLPEDVIRNILKRLTVKPLTRSQCVCKHWKNVINIPSFIADHLHHSAQQNPYLLYRGHFIFDPSGWCLFNQEMQVVKDQIAPLNGSLSGVRILASINGLLCFLSDDLSLSLWNPATRKVKKVSEERRVFVIGFGFSSILNDYRIVRIHVSRVDWHIRGEEFLFCPNRVDQAQVYSVSTGSWKEVEFGNLDGISLMPKSSHTNGAIFWFGFMLSVGKQDENDGHVVVSFDIATEVFTLIPLPSSAPKSHYNVLTVHENKLAMLCHTTIGHKEFSLIDLWVMEEGTDASRERWNWTKKYSTSPFPYLLLPGTIRGNEIACQISCIGATRCEENRREAKVVLFNIITNECKMFDIPKYGDGDGCFFNYVESLVSVGDNHIEEF